MTSHRIGNYKQENINFFGWIEVPLDNSTGERTYYCNICKLFWDHNVNGSINLRNHIKDTHGYVDSG